MIHKAELIIPDNRIRRTFAPDEIEALAKSIESKGIIHPPTLRSDCVTLLAGERRVRAMLKLHAEGRKFSFEGHTVDKDYIPYNLAGDLSETELLEAELEENTIRVDLDWRDHSRAVAELHALREAQHGKFDRSTGEGWTAKDTMREILGYIPTGNNLVREAQTITKHLDDPDVATAKTKKEALKIITRKATAEHNAKLAETFDLSRTPHTILHGDMRDILPTFDDNTFDVLLTDPPYGVDAHKFGDMADTAHEYEDSPAYFNELIDLMAKESYRICKPEAHAYIFCDIRNFHRIHLAFTMSGWDVWATPLIWHKGNVGMLPRPEHGPRRCYEAVVYAIKGDRKCTAIYSDVIDVPGIQQPRFGAEKPPELYANLLRRSIRPGDRVLDCFAGAGPILPAATQLNVQATCIELSLEKYHHQLTRINEQCPTTSSSGKGAHTPLGSISLETLISG